MSDISLVVDTSGVVNAVNATKKLDSGWSKMVSSIVSENNRMEKALSRTSAVQLEAQKRLALAEKSKGNDEWFSRQRRKMQMMEASVALEQKVANEAAKASKIQEAASNRAAMATKSQGQALEQLRTKYQPLYAASKQYEKVLEEIEIAYQTGILSSQQYTNAVNDLTAEYTAFGNGSAGWSNQFVTNSDRAAKSANRFGVVTQQVGYQVGDFLVQVQGGQSVFVAFSQQATQLAGILPMMTGAFGLSQTALIGLSAALGIGIPLVTALGNVLFTTWKSSRDAGDGVESLEEKLKSARTEIANSEGAVRLLNSGFESMALLTLDDEVANAQRALTTAIKDSAEMQEKLNEAGRSDVRIYGERVLEAEELVAKRQEELDLAVAQLAEEKRLKGLQDDRIEAVSSFLALMQARREDQLSETRELQNQVAEMERANDLMATKLVHGKDSLNVLEQSIQNEREVLEIALAQSTASEEIKNQKRLQFEIAAQLTVEEYNAAEAARVAASMASNLARNLANAAAQAARISANLGQAPIGIKEMEQQAQNLVADLAAVKAGQDRIALSSVEYRRELEKQYGLSSAASEAEDAYISGLINRQVELYESNARIQEQINDEFAARDKLDKAAESGSKKKASASKLSKEAKKAEAAAQKELNALEKEGEALNDKYRTSVEKYSKEVGNLDAHLKAGRITTDTYTRAMEDLQKTLTDSKPLVGDLIDAFAEFASQGFKDFEGFVDKVKSLFTNLIKDMIATALRNKILIPIQTAMSGGSGIGSALSGVSGAISGGSGTLGLLGATGAAFGQGATASLSAFASGGLSGGMGFVGTALSQATASLPAFGAALGAAVPVLGALTLGIMAFKGKTKELDAGINLNIKGNELLAESYRKVEKSRFFGLSKSKSTSTSSVDSGPFADAYAAIYNGASNAAKALGISSKALDSYTATLNISTKGLDEAEAQAAILEGLQEAQNGLAEKFFNALGEGSYGLIGAGEELGSAMERIRVSIETVNPLLKALGGYTLDLGLAGANAATRFVEFIGGLDQASASVGTYIDSFYTAGEKAKLVINQLGKGFSELGLNGKLPKSKEAFRAIIDNQLANGQMRNAAGLIKLAPLFDEWIAIREEAATRETGIVKASAEQRQAILESNRQAEKSLQSEIYELTGNVAALRKIELEGLTGMRRVLQQRIYSLEDAKAATEKAAQAEQDRTAALKAITDERKGLVTELYQALGYTTALRNMELAALDPSNRALQRRIYAIEDEAAANEKAAVAAQEAADKRAAIAEERKGLIEQMLTLQGKTVELRKRELAELDPTNRSLQMYIYKLEDAQVAADKAAQAEEDRLAKQTAIIDERKSLEERLLTLQGNTAELRRRELAALDPTNRALQLTIYKLEDMQAALEDLDPTKFTTRFEYEMAQARQRVTGISPSSTFSGSSASSTAPVAVVQSDPETIKELKVLRTTVEDLLIKIEDNTGREYGVIREWNRTGLPKERV